MLPELITLQDGDPAAAEIAARLAQFNQQQAGAYDFAPLRLAQFDAHGALLGGVLGATGWGWLQVDMLFVDQDARGQGIGRALMQAAHAQARVRGCTGAFLDTFDFQARGFYEKLGYTLFGTLENMPRGHRRFYLHCAL